MFTFAFLSFALHYQSYCSTHGSFSTMIDTACGAAFFQVGLSGSQPQTGLNSRRRSNVLLGGAF
jgi:hypothetical protein